MNRRISTAIVEFVKVWGLLAVVVVAGFVIAYQYVGVAPPKVVRIATGAKNGAYYTFAQEYARLLASNGITLEVIPTAGSVENLELLKKGEVSLALIQGGSATKADKERLQSLGSLFLEPVWIFTRKQSGIKRFLDLKGKRVSVGIAGSGTHLLATQLLSAAGITETNTRLLREETTQADSLSNGKIDAAFFVASPQAPIIQKLFAVPALELLDFDRAAAYGRLFPFLTPVTLSEGVIDLQQNIPSHDTPLVAASANLAARADLNASLIPAVLNAVTRVHQAGGVLEHKRQFPSVDFADLTLNEDARRYLINGPSFLYRWLPYGTAVLLDRLKILVLPFLALLLPLFKVAPPLYTWRIRSKIYRWYAAVREVESSIQEVKVSGDAASLINRLSELDRQVASVSVPLSYAAELYHLRLHIRFLQEKLTSASSRSDADERLATKA